MKNKRIRVIILEQEGAVKVKMVRNTLEKMQHLVGGNIAVIRNNYFYIYKKDEFMFDDSLIKNKHIKSIEIKNIKGNVVLVKGIDKEGKEKSFPLEQAKNIKKIIEEKGL